MRPRHGLPRRPSLSTSREPHDLRGGSSRSFAPDSRPGRLAGWSGSRPSLLLWRHRHLVVAICLGTAVLVALSVLRPGPERGQQVLVASRTISAGAILTEQDVSISTLPAGALPQSPLTSAGQAVGSRAAISLEKGTVLTASMTSGSLAQQLGDDERLVQVAIDVGAELARPGARVDIIGQAPEGWTPPGRTRPLRAGRHRIPESSPRPPPHRRTRGTGRQQLPQPAPTSLLHRPTRDHQDFKSLLRAYPKEYLSRLLESTAQFSVLERE